VVVSNTLHFLQIDPIVSIIIIIIIIIIKWGRGERGRVYFWICL